MIPGSIEDFFSQVLNKRDALKYTNLNSGLNFNPGLTPTTFEQLASDNYILDQKMIPVLLSKYSSSVLYR